MKRVSIQRGATLIVVLIMLVLLTLVGTWAIRGSLTSLNIATNSQIGQLLLQTGDTPTNLLLNRSNYKNLTSITSVVGKAISDQKDPLNMVVNMCFVISQRLHYR